MTLYIVSILCGVMISTCSAATYCAERPPTSATGELKRQTEAVQIVWRDIYGILDHEPPPIEWVPWTKLTYYGRAWFAMNTSSGDLNVIGLFFPHEYRIQCALPHRSQPFSKSSLAHELMHAALFKLFGNEDGKHISSNWKAGGALEKANHALREAGL